ncbi:MAG: hypothetical protein IJR00_11495 [Lachnospiraceae bacterium]|nr:hypothetical protein [Lachnospiraceae bacterium]
MGRRITVFDFVSAKERKRREEEFFRQSFPLGEAQKEKEKELLQALFPGKSKQSVLYNMLTIKDAIREEDDLPSAVAYWKGEVPTQDLTPEEQELMIRYTLKSIRTQSLEQYPDAEHVTEWLQEEDLRSE